MFYIPLGVVRRAWNIGRCGLRGDGKRLIYGRKTAQKRMAKHTLFYGEGKG